MKKRTGNSLLKSLEIKPKRKRKVFHIRVNAQNIVNKCIKALTPEKMNIKSVDISTSDYFTLRGFGLVSSKSFGFEFIMQNWVTAQLIRSRLIMTKN